MNRKFKMTGALMVVVAVFALTASSASATFTSAGYPATVSGSSTADKLDAFGSTIECTSNTFGGTLAAASTTLTVSPSYTNCKAFGLPMTLNFTGCDYVFHHTAGTNITTDLACPVGVKGVDITIYSSSAHTSALCHVVITPFTNKPGVSAHNNGAHVNVTGTIEGIAAHQERTNFLCPAGTETNVAKYTIQAAGITMAGNNGAVSVS